MSSTKKKVALVILDGWGLGKRDETDAIFSANTPFMDGLLASEPNATLNTTGEKVGLPAGQMGNSEVGHMNIGAGRVVFQDLARIDQAIEQNELANNSILQELISKAKSGRDLHLMGLVGHGGVHSSQKHLLALIDQLETEGVERYFIHAFTDGRDTDPKDGLKNIQELEEHLKDKNGSIGSVIGRYFSMDRDQRWERIKKAYDLLIHGKGTSFENAIDGIRASYAQGVTDEFVEPICITTDGAPVARIKADDLVLCFNFRTDRCRQITRALTQESFNEFGMQPLDLGYYTMTQYDATFKNVSILFEKTDPAKTLGEVISKAGLSQVRMSETEKYPHVTFFFSGGREQPFPNEQRIMINSPKVATYDLQPEMSALEVTDKMLQVLDEGAVEFVCLNYANPDMVGHTGVFDAIKKAVETVDECTSQIVQRGQKNGYSFIIIADHGNADNAVNADGSPNTAHSTNPVPVVIIDESVIKVNDGILADVAPTVLELLGIDQPVEMTGRSLIS